MVSGRTYLTGGTGSRHKREDCGDRYELPPDRAYCETCAAIASIMWNWRMLLVTGEARFAALLERTLYNGFLSGLGLDGATFFYVNPLHERTPARRQPPAARRPRVIRPAPAIDAVRGCVAFERGPLVYCLEETDIPYGAAFDGRAGPDGVLARLSVPAGPEPWDVPGFEVAGQ